MGIDIINFRTEKGKLIIQWKTPKKSIIISINFFCHPQFITFIIGGNLEAVKASEVKRGRDPALVDRIVEMD